MQNVKDGIQIQVYNINNEIITISDEMLHKFLCASSLHHSVFDFLQPKPRQFIGILVRGEFVVINDSLFTFTAHPTAHTWRVLV